MNFIIDIILFAIGLFYWEEIYNFTRNRSTYDDLYLFNSKLREMLKLNLPMAQCIQQIYDETFRPLNYRYSRFGRTLKRVMTHVQKGSSLGDAMEKENRIFPQYYLTLEPDRVCERVFPVYYVNIIKTGEKEGNLPGTLETLNGYLNVHRECGFTYQQSATYSIVLIVYMLAIVNFLTTYITPTFVALSEGMDLPVDLSYLLMKLIPRVVSILFWIFVVLVIMRRFRFLRSYIDRIYMKIPFFGKLGKNFEYMIFCRVMSGLLNRSMPADRALTLASGACSSPFYSERLNSVVSRGMEPTLTESLRKSRLFDETFLFMVALGENTENLPETFSEMADFYETDYKITQKNSLRIFETGVTLIVGICAGIIAIGTFTPIMKIVGVMCNGIFY